MAGTITIKLDNEIYIQPTQDDIQSAKLFVRQRNEYASLLVDMIDDILKETEEKIITICYKHDVNPQKFSISSVYNEQMADEIFDVMDDSEEKIFRLIQEYSTRVSNDKDRVSKLLAWMLLLGRNNRNLRQTLDKYLYKFMKDIEAAVAALKFAKTPLAQAITKAKTYLHSIYTMPEVQQAFKHADSFTATYIRSRGVVKGNVGLSNNGSNNVTNMARITLHMVWMRSQAMDFREQGAIGYYQLRGSNYNCSICDDGTGFHKGIADIFLNPLPHPSCQCYRIPIFSKEQV